MNVKNTNKFYISSIKLDLMIKKRKSLSYDKVCSIPVSHPIEVNTGFQYTINYNLLHKQLIKEGGDKTIFYSLFSNSSFRNKVKSVTVVEGIGDTNILSYSDGPLGFDFWCVSPATNSFLNILIVTSETVPSIEFHTSIIPCTRDIYREVSYLDTVIQVPYPDRLITCSNKLISTKSKCHGHYIATTFNIPCKEDPRKCMVKIWGAPNIDSSFVFQKEGVGVEGIGISKWRDYLCTDKTKLSNIKNGWTMCFPVQYLPQTIIHKYTQVCNIISEKKYIWLLDVIGCANSVPEPLETIIKLEKEQYGLFIRDLDVNYKSEMTDVQVNPDTGKVPIRVEIDKRGDNFRCLIFYDNSIAELKTVDEHTAHNLYYSIMDDQTKLLFPRYKIE